MGGVGCGISGQFTSLPWNIHFSVIVIKYMNKHNTELMQTTETSSAKGKGVLFSTALSLSGALGRACIDKWEHWIENVVWRHVYCVCISIAIMSHIMAECEYYFLLHTNTNVIHVYKAIKLLLWSSPVTTPNIVVNFKDFFCWFVFLDSVDWWLNAVTCMCGYPSDWVLPFQQQYDT